MIGLFEVLLGFPCPGFEFSPSVALCYTPKAKKSEMATDWEIGRPPDLVFCEVFWRGQVVRGVQEGWTFFREGKGFDPLCSRTLDVASITAWRIPEAC
ncbi:hypothetical protein [Herbaspirillum sp. CAH-3]|uniref:hypothetical protein n=1 Tax=Herbaspirillum sp. CAH-3 TaxID=2605746 RepID=UPI0012ACF793|nr:hypothetical protein [Herbaspirillum sp. CAH-3]MRT30804.1 hypothetical protein [Herbaspirillum sp. CAH-3]